MYDMFYTETLCPENEECWLWNIEKVSENSSFAHEKGEILNEFQRFILHLRLLFFWLVWWFFEIWWQRQELIGVGVGISSLRCSRYFSLSLHRTLWLTLPLSIPLIHQSSSLLSFKMIFESDKPPTLRKIKGSLVWLLCRRIPIKAFDFSIHCQKGMILKIKRLREVGISVSR
jgi:hypothetical protein